MKYLLIFTLIITTVYQSMGENNLIDIKLDKCLETRHEKDVMEADCIFEAEEAWDKELNKIYKLLRKKLSKEVFSDLKTTQIKWIHFKEKELEFWGGFYESEIDKGNLRHAVYAPNMAYKKYELTKSRTIALQLILDMTNY